MTYDSEDTAVQMNTITPVETTEPAWTNTSDEDVQKYPYGPPMYEYQTSIPTTLSSTQSTQKKKRRKQMKNDNKVIKTLKRKQITTNRTVRKLSKRILQLESMLKKVNKKVNKKR